MRFLLYNIRYGAGAGGRFHLPVPFGGYLKRTTKNLAQIADYIKSLHPDIIGLIEVDSGSFRSRKYNQAAIIAEKMGHYYVYQSKYSMKSLMQRLPIVRKQGNAFLTSQQIHAKTFHYFREGVKRLVIELELKDCVIFLVHLSLKFRHRQHQLSDLYTLFKKVKKPIIVAGDFNIYWGDRETDMFLAATRLKNANVKREMTYPSKQPTRELDFILHSPGIKITNFKIPHVKFSDHLPIVCDFEVVTKNRNTRNKN